MSKGDIGNYLGLAVETISRIPRHFVQDGIFKVNGRNLQINIGEIATTLGTLLNMSYIDI